MGWSCRIKTLFAIFSNLQDYTVKSIHIDNVLIYTVFINKEIQFQQNSLILSLLYEISNQFGQNKYLGVWILEVATDNLNYMTIENNNCIYGTW